MRNLFLSLGAVALTATTLVIPTSAEARKHYYRTYNGRGGHTYCTHSGGTTGAVVGGVGRGGSVEAGPGEETLQVPRMARQGRPHLLPPVERYNRAGAWRRDRCCGRQQHRGRR